MRRRGLLANDPNFNTTDSLWRRPAARRLREFTAGVEESDLAAKSARIESQIRPGQNTRQEVRARLGTPIFESSDWGVELYLSDADVAIEWAVVLLVPFPMAVREFRLYPLVVYSSSDVVQGIGAGQFAELPSQTGWNSPGGTGADVLGFTLAIDPCDEPWCLWLLAPADRSVPSLRAPPAPGRCVINIAKPDNGVQVALDDRTLLRSIGWSYGGDNSVPAGSWFARVSVAPGTHTVRATPMGLSLFVGGELIQTIDCRGDQWFVVRVARHFQKASSFFNRAQLTGEVQVFDSLDAIPDDARLILFHNNRSLTAAH